MTDRSAEHWYPTAAYLYVLHLNGPALAGILAPKPRLPPRLAAPSSLAGRGAGLGLRLLEDPALDARDAHPAWFPDHDAVVQLLPDADPPPEADAFEFWRVPGRKQLIHDGKRLVLVSHWPGCCLRLALAPGLEDGMAYLYATRACAAPCARYRALAAGLDALSAATVAAPAAAARSRPTPAAVLELHTCRRSTRPWRVRPCVKWPKGCSARMPSRPTGTRTAPCVPACGGWCAVARR